MMNRDEALVYSKSLGITPITYGEECIMVDTILAIKQFEKCSNCEFINGEYCSNRALIVHRKQISDSFSCTLFKPKL